MVTTSAHFSMIAGEYRALNVTVQQDGLTVNLSGVQYVDWALAVNERSEPLFRKSYPTSGVLLSDPTNGVFTVEIDREDTAELEPGIYYHQAQYVINDQTITAFVGTVRIRPTII